MPTLRDLPHRRIAASGCSTPAVASPIIRETVSAPRPFRGPRRSGKLELNMATLLFAPQPLAYVTRAAPHGADSEPRTSESGCAITYDVLFRTFFMSGYGVLGWTSSGRRTEGAPPFAQLPSTWSCRRHPGLVSSRSRYGVRGSLARSRTKSRQARFRESDPY